MAAAGNLAAKSHERLLQDVEKSLEPIFTGFDSQQIDAALQWVDMEGQSPRWTDPFDESFGLPPMDLLLSTPAHTPNA